MNSSPMNSSPAEAATLPAWQQPLPKEVGKPWEAFCWYRDLGPDRSLDRVVQKYNKSRPLIARWSSAYSWVERVHAYDVYRADQARLAAEAEHAAKITAYRERASKIGAATADVALGFLVAAGRRLKGLTENKPGQEGIQDIPIKSLPSFLRAAAAIGQISLSVEAESLGVRELEGLLSADDEDAAEDPA